MCLSPIRLVNPTKYISKFGGQLFQLEVPCGECAECKERAREAWYFRSYYECKEMFDKGGYVLFDTLTYAPEYLPMIHDVIPNIDASLDYPCFCPEHIRRFLLDIRQYWSKELKHRINLGYFLTTEYGLNPGDGKTFRPHYHILFFVNEDIDPFDFSRSISKYWKYGRTDGLPYKTQKYVLDHVYGKKYCKDQVHMRTVCNYVSKYVTKDSDFQKIIDERIDKLREYLYGDGRKAYSTKCDINKKVRDIKRRVSQFHRQSQGFGLYYFDQLSNKDLKEMLDSGMMKMDDKNDIVKHAPLCAYYNRKLLYEKKISKDGQAYWTLSDFGRRYKMEKLLKNIDRVEKRYDELYMNIPFYHNRKDADKYMSEIVKLLDGRSFRELAIYNLMYRGRVRYNSLIPKSRLVEYTGCQSNVYNSRLTREEADLSVWVNYLFKDLQLDIDNNHVWYHYGSTIDRKYFEGSTFVTDRFLGIYNPELINKKKVKVPITFDKDKFGFDELCDTYRGSFLDVYHKSNQYMLYTGTTFANHEIMTPKEFIERHCFNENSDRRFRNFDKLLSLLRKISRKKDEDKQRLFDHTERLIKVMKSLSVS